MLQGLQDVFSSGRSVFGLIILLCMAVFVVVGDMTVQQWQSSAEWVLAFVIGAQTVTTTAGIIKTGSAAKPVTAKPEQPA